MTILFLLMLLRQLVLVRTRNMSKVSNPIMHIKSSNRQNMAGRMKNGNSLQNIQRDSRQSHKITQKESSKKRTSERELITSGNDDRSDISAKDTFERLVPFTITEGVILTGDRAKDDLLRDSHCYEGAPCFPLFKVITGQNTFV